MEIILLNKHTEKILHRTQSHHVIPRFFFEESQIEVDNSDENLVNLFYKDHVLAHYYLAMCVKDNYVYKAFVPIFIILGNSNFPDSEKNLLSTLDDIQILYEKARKNTLNPMFNEDIKIKHDSIMRSEDVRNKISNTIKHRIDDGVLFNESHRHHLSESASGRIHINKDGKLKHIKVDELSKYLEQGWEVGGLPVPEELVQRRAKARSCPVRCLDVNGQVVETFDSVKEACAWWVNNGYTKKIPEDVYQLANKIKQSSVNQTYICGLTWEYLEKERKYKTDKNKGVI